MSGEVEAVAERRTQRLAPDVQDCVPVTDATGIAAVGGAKLQQQLYRVQMPVLYGANQRLVNDLVPVAAHTDVGAPVGENANGAQVASTGSQHHGRLVGDGEVGVGAEAAQRREQCVVVLGHYGFLDAGGSGALEVTKLAHADGVVVQQPRDYSLETSAGGTEHAAAHSAVVAPHDGAEVRVTLWARKHKLVRNPIGSPGWLPGALSVVASAARTRRFLHGAAARKEIERVDKRARHAAADPHTSSAIPRHTLNNATAI